jgi:hypothetical protein
MIKQQSSPLTISTPILTTTTPPLPLPLNNNPITPSSSIFRPQYLFFILIISTLFAIWRLLTSVLEIQDNSIYWKKSSSWIQHSTGSDDKSNHHQAENEFFKHLNKDIDIDNDKESNWTRNDILLPRTYHGPYSELDMSNPKKRYFLYSASGGFNNQRMELEYALMIGKFLNRTVYIPQVGKHTQMWWKYEALEPRHLFPMDRVIDFKPLLKITPCVPLDIPVHEFATVVEKKIGSEQVTTIFHQSNAGWTERNLEPFLSNKKKLLYFRGGNIYHQWWPWTRMLQVRRAVRFSPMLRNTALGLIMDKFSLDKPQSINLPRLEGSQIVKYNAVHVRLGDYADRTPSSSSYERRCVNQGFTPDVPLVVATEPNPPKGFFNSLCKPSGTFKCIFSKDFNRTLVKQYMDVFPPGQIRNDMLGLVEQLVCVGADRFVGTDFSTFSYSISFMRKNKGAAFPEIAKVKGLKLAREMNNKISTTDSSNSNNNNNNNKGMISADLSADISMEDDSDDDSDSSIVMDENNNNDK